ncbi:MAG: helix-turn-helix domain-containing protein [Terracidiphilus sp.]|jgi:two-component system nitrogen regulation response regulator NtrX
MHDKRSAVLGTEPKSHSRLVGTLRNARTLRIERKHLPPLTHKAAARSSDEFSSLQQARDAYEREYILKKIEEARNNISHADELLGLERSLLYRKMKALGIGVRE